MFVFGLLLFLRLVLSVVEKETQQLIEDWLKIGCCLKLFKPF